MRLADFRVLSFDCYGTLIDWEHGLWQALQPLLQRGTSPMTRDEVLAAFARHESEQQQATPHLPYSELLAEVHRRLAQEWHLSATAADHRRFSQSVNLWPAFADTPAALRYLQQHYQLVILSNVDHQSFAGSAAQLGVTCSAVYTAQDIGSYKPDPANFRYLLDRLAELGHDRSDILHVAQSLFHDHAPAQDTGLATAWIDRRGQRGMASSRQSWGATMPPPASARYDFHYPDLAALVQAHQNELADSIADRL